jgi:hypothetical protein
MLDCFKQQLAEGDVVAMTPDGYKCLVHGTVVGFTERMVRVAWCWPNRPDQSKVSLRYPADLVKGPCVSE